MKTHDGTKRGFYWSTKAYYSRTNDEREIMFGLFAGKDGGTTGEMGMRWHLLGNEWVPRLECYSDGWSALAMFPDLITELGRRDSDDPTEQEFVNLLLSLGFEDLTDYERPRSQLAAELERAEKHVEEIREKMRNTPPPTSSTGEW